MEEHIYCSDVIEILDKWEILFGQRTERELWNTKSTEEQEKDIEEFKNDLEKVRKLLEQEF